MSGSRKLPAPERLRAIRKRERRGGRDSGFTLLETLVAVLVLAVLVGVVPRSLVAARTNIERSNDFLEARLVAESLLAETLVGQLTAGVMEGTVDGRPWRATLRPTQAPPSQTGRVLLEVDLQVQVAGSRMLEVETMRIGVMQ